MQKYRQAAISIAFLTFLLTGGITMGRLGVNSDDNNDGGQNKEELLLDSFENNDYNFWKKTISKKADIYKVVDKNDFERFTTARSFARAGDYDNAIKLTEKIEVELRERLKNIIV